jgi:serine/threonine-protein kinase
MTQRRAPDPPWQDIDRLFDAALDAPVEQRRAVVDAGSGGHAALRDAVLRLLDAEAASAGRFEAPGVSASNDFMNDLAGRARPDQRLGPYTLVRELGRGGMGTVYLAEHEGEDFRRDVAIKVLRRGVDTDDVLRRFVTERRILASLTHPNIARLYDGGATPDGRPYLVMERVDGLPITVFADAQRLPIRARLELLLQAADAVRAAHTALIVHRDLKPSNILVTTGGHVKLLDFGIAKLLDSTDAVDQTRTGLYILTPDHASPEQLRGEPITTSTDVYQLGVLLYRLLSGASPFGEKRATVNRDTELSARMDIPRLAATVAGARDPAALAAARGTTPGSLARALSGDLEWIAGRALHHDESRRYASVEELSRDLKRYLDGHTVSARPDTLAYRTRMYLRRHPWVAPATGAAVIFLAIYLGTQMRHTVALEVERNAARLEAERALEVQQFMVGLFGSADPYLPTPNDAGRAITVAEALDVGTERLRTTLVDRPVVRAAVLAAISTTYQALGLYDRALPLREEVVELQVALFGDGSREHRDSLRALASIQGQLGHESLARLQQRLDLALAAEPIDAQEVADARLHVGRHFLTIDGTDDAREQFEKSLASARPGATASLEVGEATRALADLQRIEQRFEESERTARQAVILIDEVAGPDSIPAGFARGSLAHSLGLLGRSDEAETYFVEAIERLEGPLGSDHKHVLDTKRNLAAIRTLNGNFEGAIALSRELVESGERIYGGPDHPQLSTSLQNLGAALLRANRLDEARTILERAAAINRAWLTEDNYLRVLPHLSLTSVHLTQRRPAAAEAAAREALKTFAIALPEAHYITAVADCRLARALVAQGRKGEAAAHFARATPPLLETRSVPEYRIECLGAAADFHVAQGDSAAAARLRAAIAAIGG